MDFSDTICRLIRGWSLHPILILLPLFILALPVAAESLSVLSQNMNRFFDDIDDGNQEKILSGSRFRQRVKIAAEKFGDNHGLPHIIALQEVENLNGLQHIAAEIRDRYQARYRLILIPGQDISGINLAFLVRYGVEIKKIDQLFRDEIAKPGGNPLFSRPPLYLEACYIERCVALLNLHLRSMRGIDSEANGDRIRRKRKRQAETIANWVSKFQKSRPQDSLLVLGDLNALTPSDEHVDIAGIIRGNPDNAATLLTAADLVQPDLVDLTERVPPAKRYSFIFRRQKQLLDYMFVNQSFAVHVEKIAFSRIDYRFSDHAGLLAWFKWQ